MLERAWSAIVAWYIGEWAAHKNEPGSSIFFIGGDTHYHWTARVARFVVGFFAKEWKWIIGTGLAVCGLLIAVARH